MKYITDNDLRSLYITDPGRFDNLSLSPLERVAVIFVTTAPLPVTSMSIASHVGRSLTQVNALLKSCIHKGYLTRSRDSQFQVGNYEYTMVEGVTLELD